MQEDARSASQQARSQVHPLEEKRHGTPPRRGSNRVGIRHKQIVVVEGNRQDDRSREGGMRHWDDDEEPKRCIL